MYSQGHLELVPPNPATFSSKAFGLTCKPLELEAIDEANKFTHRKKLSPFQSHASPQIPESHHGTSQLTYPQFISGRDQYLRYP